MNNQNHNNDGHNIHNHNNNNSNERRKVLAHCVPLRPPCVGSHSVPAGAEADSAEEHQDLHEMEPPRPVGSEAGAPAAVRQTLRHMRLSACWLLLENPKTLSSLAAMTAVSAAAR